MAKLAAYRSKRNFTRTSEPKGFSSRGTKASGLSFVVQKHDASRLHYDFRLELAGVLKSWAVTRGPSLVAGEKRLAVQVEDHPIDYGAFEGTIPEGQYGGGIVMVWDYGTWKAEGDPEQGYAKGHLSFTLEGKKLKGLWHLVRMHGRPRERQVSWLLIKGDDAEALSSKDPDILSAAPLSVKTGRTLEEIAGGKRKMNEAKDAKVKGAKAKTSKTQAPAAETAMSHQASPKPGTTRKDAKKKAVSVEVADVPLSHPDRLLWKNEAITKQDLAEFYVQISDWLLPHLIERPLTLIRCPLGMEGGCFVQRHSWAGFSPFIRREMIKDKTGEQEVLFVHDIRGVVALVQAGVMEMHVWSASIDKPDLTDRLIFDLDPGPGVEWPAVIDAALALRARLQTLKLESFVKLTGGKGLHVVVPLKPKLPWAKALAFTRDMAETMADEEPERYTTTSAKHEREGRIFIDYLRNNREASAVAPYSTRARPGAPVSVPVAWQEVSSSLKPDAWTLLTVPKRLKALRKDPWADLGRIEQSLPKSFGRRRKPSHKQED